MLKRVRISRSTSMSSLLSWWAVIAPSPTRPMPKPLIVLASTTDGAPRQSTAARRAAWTFSGSWPPRRMVRICSSVSPCDSLIRRSSPPKKCCRWYSPVETEYFWYWPSTSSPMRRAMSPSGSRASSGSQSEPQITLMTFHSAPRKTVSSSWMILALPRTGPSRRCRLQLMTKTRLSSRSRDAREIAPRASGSSISPSPRKAQTLAPPGSLRPRSSR